jgi:hypothetical protein
MNKKYTSSQSVIPPTKGPYDLFLKLKSSNSASNMSMILDVGNDQSQFKSSLSSSALSISSRKKSLIKIKPVPGKHETDNLA